MHIEYSKEILKFIIRNFLRKIKNSLYIEKTLVTKLISFKFIHINYEIFKYFF
jgi:hypothetical protein